MFEICTDWFLGSLGPICTYMSILGMCHFDTPIFKPRFPLQSISFLKRTDTLQSITILELLPLRRPSFNKCHRPWPVYCGQPEREAFRQLSGAKPARMHPDARYKSAPVTTHFTRQSAPGPRCIKLPYLTIVLTTVWLTINRSYHRLIISVA